MLRPNGSCSCRNGIQNRLNFQSTTLLHGTRALSDIWHMTPHHGERDPPSCFRSDQSTADDHSQTWTFRVGKGFELMAKKEAIKVIFTYDFDDED